MGTVIRRTPNLSTGICVLWSEHFSTED